MNFWTLSAFLCYMAMLLGVGLWARKKTASVSDFLMGGRSLNFWVTALSAHASDMSSWLFMAFPMAIYTGGLANAWIGIFLCLGMFANWHFVAPKLRQFTEDYNSFTISSFFGSRFSNGGQSLRLICAIATLIFVTHYIAAGLTSLGFLFETIFAWNYYAGISCACVVVLTYTLIGGYVSVAWTDFFQGVFLLIMICIVPIVGFWHIDGFSSILEAAQKKHISMSLIPRDQSILSVFLESLAWGLGYFGMPHILTKFMGIKNTKDIYKAKILGMSWQVISLTAATFVGLVSLAYFKEPLANEELIFVHLVKDLFHPFLGGFVLCGFVAATVSTMDSQILVVSTTVAEDLFLNFKKDLSQKTVLLISRASILGVTLVALALAWDHNSSIFQTVFYAWSGLGCAFGPLMLFALYSKKTTAFGASAGVVVGTVVAFIWPSIQPMIEFKIPTMILGFGLSSLAILFFSRVCPLKLRN